MENGEPDRSPEGPEQEHATVFPTHHHTSPPALLVRSVNKRGLWWETMFYLDGPIRANRFRLPEPNPFFCESRFRAVLRITAFSIFIGGGRVFITCFTGNH